MANQTVNTQPQVIVTRPSPYGEALCGELEAANFFCLHTPLIRFEADNRFTPVQRLRMLEESDTWIFVSRQAVNFCFESYPQGEMKKIVELSKTKTVIAVGSATAASLQGFKIEALTPPTPNSEGMIQLLEKYQLKEAPALLVRGNKGRELLEQYFAQSQLSFLPVYKRIETQKKLPQIKEPDITALIVTSGQIMELVDNALSIDTSKAHITIIAGSERINKMAQHMGYANCYTAKDASNFELVKSCILWRNDVS